MHEELIREYVSQTFLEDKPVRLKRHLFFFQFEKASSDLAYFGRCKGTKSLCNQSTDFQAPARM